MLRVVRDQPLLVETEAPFLITNTAMVPNGAETAGECQQQITAVLSGLEKSGCAHTSRSYLRHFRIKAVESKERVPAWSQIE
jgi:hypothetical protein